MTPAIIQDSEAQTDNVNTLSTWDGNWNVSCGDNSKNWIEISWWYAVYFLSGLSTQTIVESVRRDVIWIKSHATSQLYLLRTIIALFLREAKTGCKWVNVNSFIILDIFQNFVIFWHKRNRFSSKCFKVKFNLHCASSELEATSVNHLNCAFQHGHKESKKW